MKEKTHYPGKSTNSALEVIREITFSTDPADFYYMDVNVPCQSACPAYTNIPAYIRCLFEERYSRSYELNRIVNVVAASRSDPAARSPSPKTLEQVTKQTAKVPLLEANALTALAEIPER